MSSSSDSDSLMRAWQVVGPNSPLEIVNIPRPKITEPGQVLIRVKAASVNPIDTVMVKGYGQSVMSMMKRKNPSTVNIPHFPLVAGRDCAGIIEEVGDGVEKYKVGDKVMAVIPPIYMGCHAEFVVTDSSACARLPLGMDFVEAASLPYAACTSWAALVTMARLKPNGKPAAAVLIHGGGGGVGTMAIQQLKAWGVPKVVTTCSPDSFSLVRSLGAIPVDYHAGDATDRLVEEGPFEVIFDCCDSELARWSDNVMGMWNNSVHVTICSPVARSFDQYGLVLGGMVAVTKYLSRSLCSAFQGRWFAYAFFRANEECMEQLSQLASEKKIKPIVEQVLEFDHLPLAYNKVEQRHGRGKTVIKMD